MGRIGKYGNPDSKKPLKAGFSVTVYNRTKEKENELIESGATSAENPQALTQTCDVVITMVLGEQGCMAIYKYLDRKK